MAGRSFAPFRHRAFRLVWSGALVSNVGTWMETTALSYYVADTSTASASGLVAAAGFLPTAVLGPVGGAWADRFSRRRVIILANAAAMVIAAAVAVLVASGEASPGILALFSLAGGCAGALGFPAFQAALPDVVPAEDLVAAIGLSSTQWNLGRIIGPSAAALAIAAGGVPTALWINAASFGAVIVAVGLAAIPRRIGVKRSVLAATRDGISFARRTPAPRAMVPLMVVQVLIAAPFIGFIAQMATNVFDEGQNGTSVLVTAQGIGAVVAGASMGGLSSRFGLRAVLLGAILLSAPCLIFYGAAPNLWVGAVGVMLLGGCYMASLSACTTVTQKSAPPELRGRAMAVNNFVLGAFYPLGLLIEGEIADRISLRAVTIGSGVALAGAVGLLFLVRPSRTQAILALDRPPLEPALT
jgi:MFS family permease